MTVPVVVPSSTKSPEENGRVISSVKPAKTFESVFCSESENARPATESTATSEAEGMLSLSAMMSATSTQSSTRAHESMKLRIARSSFERSSAFFIAFISSFMMMSETRNMTTEASRFPSEKPPMSVSSSFSRSGISCSPLFDAHPLYTGRCGAVTNRFCA